MFSRETYRQTSNITRAKSPNLNVARLAVVFAQSTEARCEVKNDDAVGAAPTAMLQLHPSPKVMAGFV